MTACSSCHSLSDNVRDGLCFRCRIRTVTFTYNGAHPGHTGWHETTVMGELKEIYDGARMTGTDITRAS